MGKVKQWSMETQEQEWDKQWQLRRLELVKEYPTYSKSEIDELLELEQEDAINEWEQEKALDNADSWETPFAENH
jgi:hypothetical protein